MLIHIIESILSNLIFVYDWTLSSPAALEHYKAGMLLSGVGDALGYRNQLWEYNESGLAIHQVRLMNRLLYIINAQ